MKQTVVIPRPKNFILTPNRHHSPIWGGCYDKGKKILYIQFRQSTNPRYYGYRVPEKVARPVVAAMHRNGWAVMSLLNYTIKPKYNEVIQNAR
jgi:hypothetical protein